MFCFLYVVSWHCIDVLVFKGIKGLLSLWVMNTAFCLYIKTITASLNTHLQSIRASSGHLSGSTELGSCVYKQEMQRCSWPCCLAVSVLPSNFFRTTGQTHLRGKRKQVKTSRKHSTFPLSANTSRCFLLAVSAAPLNVAHTEGNRQGAEFPLTLWCQSRSANRWRCFRVGEGASESQTEVGPPCKAGQRLGYGPPKVLNYIRICSTVEAGPRAWSVTTVRTRLHTERSSIDKIKFVTELQ